LQVVGNGEKMCTEVKLHTVANFSEQNISRKALM